MARVLRIPLLLVGSLALSLLLCEGLVRLLVPQQLIIERPDVWYPTEGVGWRKHAHVDTTINTGERDVRLRTDGRGYRIGQRGDAPGDIGVLVLGDSFMEALQVEYEDTLAGHIEAGLADATGRSVRAYDSGVSGWGPSQYLIEARAALAELPVDLVVVAVYLGNDFEGERVDAFAPRAFVTPHSLRWPRSFDAREWVDAVLYPINDVLERSSHLFQLAKNANQALLMRLGLTARYTPLELTPSPGIAAAWDATADTIADIVALAEQQHGVPAVVVLIPSHYQVVPDALDLYRGAFEMGEQALDATLPDRQLGEALQARGIPYVDALDALSAAQSAGELVYGRVDTHLSARGHAVVYAAIETPLLDALERTRDELSGPPGQAGPAGAAP